MTTINIKKDPMKPVYNTLFVVLFLAVIWLAIDKRNKEPKKIINPTVERRESDRKEAKEREVVHDTLVKYRDRIKNHYDTIVQIVLAADTAQTNKSFDSLKMDKKDIVVMAYQYKSCTLQLSVDSSIIKNDSFTIGLLTRANLAADTLLTQAAKQAKKDKRKAFLKGFGWGTAFGFGLRGALQR